jgi:elongation factor P
MFYLFNVMPSPTDIRKGKVILYNGSPHLVLEMLHRTQGRQAGFVQVTLRNLSSGSSTTTKLRSTDSVEILMTDTRKMELSYLDQEGWHFMDPETFEDVVLPNALVEDAKDFLSEGNSVDVLFVDGEPVQVQLPASVELEVTEAPDAIRGDTSGAALKPVTVSTGLVIQTPLFVKTGDRIKVSTADKSYLGRV